MLFTGVASFQRTRKGISKCVQSAYAQRSARTTRAEAKVMLCYDICALLNCVHCRVEKAEASLKDDGEVAKLEDECNWFRGETERLQSNRTTMMKDIKVCIILPVKIAILT